MVRSCHSLLGWQRFVGDFVSFALATSVRSTSGFKLTLLNFSSEKKSENHACGTGAVACADVGRSHSRGRLCHNKKNQVPFEPATKEIGLSESPLVNLNFWHSSHTTFHSVGTERIYENYFCIPL